MMQSKRPVKGHTPPGEFFALGSKPKGGGSDSDNKPTLSQLRKPIPTHGSASSLPLKRDAPSAPSGGLVVKKPRLAGSQTFTPLGRAAEIDRRASPTTQIYLYEDIAVEVEGHELLELVEEASERSDDDRLEALLCGAVKSLKANRARPDQLLFVSLMMLAKSRPALFSSEVVIEAFCSLLKRDVTLSFKAKGNPTVSILVCNVLMAAFQDEENWPDNFVKVYMDDSLGDRIWVDRPDCRAFVSNIQTAFNTRLPQFSLLATETTGKAESAGGSPQHVSIDEEDSITYEEKYNRGMAASSSTEDDVSSLVSPRYTYQLVSVESYVLEVLREQLSRRQSMDGGSRNLVRTMTATCGYTEVRGLAAQRLEMWLQNPKLTRAAQDLLMCICMNCDLQHYQQDTEVTSLLAKIRLKTKSLVNHYVMCMRELVGQNVENIRRLLAQTISNELSATRSPNNMTLITVMMQQASEQTAKLLAEIFLDMLMGRDDCLRSLRGLLREVVRAVKHDMNYAAFAGALMGTSSETKLRDVDPIIKDRYFVAVVDLLCLSMLLNAASVIREGSVARADIKDMELLHGFQNQTAYVQRDAIWWLHSVIPKMITIKPSDCIHSMRKLLFVEKADQYYKVDNWPPENERSMILRLVADVPLLEDTLYRVLTMGLTRDLHLSSADVIDVVDTLVKRVALLHFDDFLALKVDRVEIIEIMLNLCTYRHPENIALPKGYQAPVLAITSLYWKAWIVLLVLAAFNPSSFGKKGWYEYPTLRCLMEMAMTNTFKFPPPTTAPDEKTVEEFLARECQLTEFVKQQILEFESHLAAATSKQQITEANSLLLSQLTRMEPGGGAMKPPPPILEQLKQLTQTLRIGHALCRSRDPDFLLEIIQRQGTSRSMPWLADLVESNDGSLDVLPVQCLCEFLLHDASTDGAAGRLEDDDPTHAEKQKKQKYHKQEQLLKRLQLLLQSPNVESQPVVSEVLDFFLKRLSAPQSSSRQLAVKGLSSVLSKSLLDDTDMSPMDVDINAVLSLLPGHRWLLEQLPSLPLFELLNVNICAALRLACQVETDAPAVGAYIIFLSHHSSVFDIHDLDGLALDLAQLIVERVTLVNHLLPQDDSTSDLAETVLSAMNDIFFVYLTKSQQPQVEGYQWSESQDQIRLQWTSGKSAVMNILVVHAMIILLTYGKPKEVSKFDDLLDSWFPETGSPPSAFLVDTSEEALLLPDWLKLRMIRSSVMRLVDAALVDLDPAQLLLFVQSFGIPVGSMSKLLHCLDAAVDSDPGTMEGAVVDKGYMAQLIEVQRMRGATGGHRFYELLLEGHSSPAPPERSGLLKVSGRRRQPSQLFRTPEVAVDDATNVDKMAALIVKIFNTLPFDDRQSQFQILLKSSRKPATADVLINSFVRLLTSPVAPSVVSGVNYHTHLACTLIRVLMLSKEKFRPLADLLSVALNGSNSTLATMIDRFQRTMSGETVRPMPNSREAALPPSEKLERILATAFQSDRQEITDVETEISVCLGGIVGNTETITDTVRRAVSTETAGRCAGLLVDWLELLSPDIISSSSDLEAVERQLEFLFGTMPGPEKSKSNKLELGGIAQPEKTLEKPSGIGMKPNQPGIARKLVFGKSELDQFGAERSRTEDTVEDVGAEKCEGYKSYLLALLTHRCHWASIQLAVTHLLSTANNVHRYSPSKVLDFLWACIHLPRLWQGRDKKLPKNYIEEDVLRLTVDDMLVVVTYILAEVEKLSSSVQREAVELIRQRMDLLQACCCNKRHLVNAVIDFLKDRIDNEQDFSGLCHCLLLDLYLWLPCSVSMADESVATSFSSALQSHSSQVDAISHRLVGTLGSAASGRAAELRMQDANIACRKMACEHPLLILRQLPMLSALLQGRAQFSFGEVRSRNYVHLYTHVLGIIELVQPHIFQSQYAAPFQDLLQAYFDLFQAHGSRRNKQLVGVVIKFLQLMFNFFNYDHRHCSMLLNKYIPTLNMLLEQFPDNPVLVSLLAGISLRLHDDGSTTGSAVDGTTPAKDGSAPETSSRPAPADEADSRTTATSATIPKIPMPFAPQQLANVVHGLRSGVDIKEITARLQELDEMSKRRVDVLEHFVGSIQRLMLHTSETCRAPAHALMMRLVRHDPRCAKLFHETMLQCLDSNDVSVVNSTLKNLAEYVVLAQENALELLQKAFVVCIRTESNVKSYVSDAVQMLNLDTLVHTGPTTTTGPGGNNTKQ